MDVFRTAPRQMTMLRSARWALWGFLIAKVVYTGGGNPPKDGRGSGAEGWHPPATAGEVAGATLERATLRAVPFAGNDLSLVSGFSRLLLPRLLARSRVAWLARTGDG